VIPIVSLALVAAAALLLGALALSLWRIRFADDPVEYGFAALTLGLLAIGWLALILAEIGVFSLPALAVGLALAVVALGFVRARRSRTTAVPLLPSPHGWDKWEAVALALWLVAAALVYFRPHEFVIGGADAGVYINLGANIANTGSITIRDPLLGALESPLREALLRPMPPGEAAPYYLLPGFYVTNAPPDLITPQFFHLHPAWQAVGYALGGLEAELLITPFWGLLGCLAVYMTVRSLWGWRWAFLALVALSFTALQVWFARYPTAEMLTQYLFWTCAWAMSRWWEPRRPASLWAGIAGASLGQVFLTRIDTYALLALPVLLALVFTIGRAWRRDAWWFFVPFLLLAAHSALHGWLITQPYFSLISSLGVRILLRGALPAAAALLAVAVLSILLIPALSRRGAAGSRLDTFARTALRVTAVLVVLLALFAYFVRPELGTIRVANYWYGGGTIPTLDRENFVRLGWYLSPLGLALGVGGIAMMLVTAANRRTAFLLAAGGFFSVVFLWRIGANPHQVYAMRRYVPQVLPFFIIGGVFLLRWLSQRRPPVGRALAVALTAGWIISIVLLSRPFATQIDYAGLANQIRELDTALPRKAVVLFNDPAQVGVADFLGTPLRFLHGRPVFLLRQEAVDGRALADAVAKWHQAGYEVVLLETSAQHPWPLPPSSLGPPREFVLRYRNLENTYDIRPEQIVPVEWRVSIRPINPTEGSP
jgi:hypothetical protein